MSDRPPAPAPPSPASGRPAKRGAFPYVLLLVLAAAAAYGARLVTLSLANESTDDAFVEAHVVAAAPKISGRITEVKVSENERVKKGDLLVMIDETDSNIQIDQAKAALNLAAAKSEEAKTAETESAAHLNSSKAEAEASEATVQALESVVSNAERDYSRYKDLVAANAIPVQDADHAGSALATARSNLEAARRTAVAARSRVGEAEAQLQARRASLQSAAAQIDLAKVFAKQVELNHSYTRLTAPCDGRVTSRKVEPGAYVQTGQALLALVPDQIWVTANFKETQLRDVRVGLAVTVKVDAWPDRALKGHVESIRSGSGAQFSLLPPENASGNYVKVVQRVPVRIVLDEALPEGATIGPGMSVVPVVHVRPIGPVNLYEGAAAGAVLLLGGLLLLRRPRTNPA